MRELTRPRSDAIRNAAAAACAVLALSALAIAPSSDERAWAFFLAATVLVAAAVCIAPRGFVYATAALFAATALKNATIPLGQMRVDVFTGILAGLALAGLLIALKRRRFRMPRLSSLEWALLAPLAAGVWSLGASLDQATTLICLVRLLVLWVAAIATSRALADEAARRTALIAFVGAGTLIAVFSIVQWALPDLGIGVVHIQGSDLPGRMLTRPAGFYLDPNFLAAHLALTSLGALALAAVGGRSRWWLVPAAVMLEGVVLTFSRSAWLALAFGLVMLFIASSKRSRLPLVGTLVAVILVGGTLVGPDLLLSRVASILLLDDGSSTTTRLFMAGSTVEMAFDRPVFGTGLGAYSEAYPEYRKPGALLRVTHPHQVPLALIAETGVAGLLAEITLLVVLYTTARRRYREGLSAVDMAVVTGLATLLLGSMLQYFLYFKPLWLLCGLLAAGTRRPVSEGPREE